MNRYLMMTDTHARIRKFEEMIDNVFVPHAAIFTDKTLITLKFSNSNECTHATHPTGLPTCFFLCCAFLTVILLVLMQKNYHLVRSKWSPNRDFIEASFFLDDNNCYHLLLIETTNHPHLPSVQVSDFQRFNLHCFIINDNVSIFSFRHWKCLLNFIN